MNEPAARSGPRGYSPLQVALHWAIAALVIFQLLVNRGMQDAFDDRMDGDAVEDAGWALLHIATGLSILVLAIVRVIVRLRHGVPPPAARRGAILNLLANVTHLALYGFIFAMPITGALAWFGRSELSAEAHELGRLILIPLILLHALGAFVEHFAFRNDTLMRMLKADPES
ncbi:MAG TPA: cytochrome b [Alphaproteobacteria bacterium]|nr:cytochrome b [Alphaproteobacteria bacterium]